MTAFSEIAFRAGEAFMMMSDYQVRCFDEKTIADLYELRSIRLGLNEERLVIKLYGMWNCVGWQMTEQGTLSPWASSSLLPVEIAVSRIAYAEVLEPVNFQEDGVTTILEVSAAGHSLAIRGHWQDGQLYEAVVTHEQPCSLVKLASCNRKELARSVDHLQVMD